MTATPQSVGKFQADFNTLKDAVAAIESSPDIRSLNELDQKIGAALHALQFGVGRMAIDIKKTVDDKKVTL